MKGQLSWSELSLLSPYQDQGKWRSSKRSAFINYGFANQSYITECSIFPGLHSEDENQYKEEFLLLPDPIIPKKPFENLDEILTAVKAQKISANLRFAYEAMHLHLWASLDLLPESWKEISSKSQLQTKVQKLITNPHQFDWGSLKSFGENCATIKMKMGRVDRVEEDIELFQSLHRQFPACRWRLDANEAYQFQDLKKWQDLCSQEQLSSIDYFENPCASPAQWSRNLTLPLALESGPLTDPSWWQQDIALAAIVHKPALSLGFFESLKFLTDMKTPIILSSTFEGAYGLRDLLLLSELSHSTQTHGLGTWEQLGDAKDYPPYCFKLHQHINKLSLSYQVDQNSLT